MNSNEVKNLRDLIVKIYRYKFITLFLIIIPICTYIWKVIKKLLKTID